MKNKLIESAGSSLIGWLDKVTNFLFSAPKTERDTNFWQRECQKLQNQVLGQQEHIKILEQMRDTLQEEGVGLFQEKKEKYEQEDGSMEFNYFDIEDFYCNCEREHDEEFVDPKLVSFLDIARDYAGIPFVITSGYRCAEHNRDIGGVSDSAHLKGKAADIKVEGSRSRFLILRSLIRVGFKRIGVYDTYIHVDIDESKSTKVVWR